MNLLPKNKRVISYIGMLSVVLIWGIYPITIRLLYDHYSAAVLNVFSSAVSTLALLIVCRGKLKKINRDYLKVAVPCGVFYALGELTQTIGFQYTTPATGSFLENMSCIVVPILMFAFIRQKPTLLKLLSVLLCISSAFLLSMTRGGGTNTAMGIFLCAFAGICYGVNIAGTGVYAKKLDPALYVLVQMSVLTLMSCITAPLLALLPTADGTPFEVIRFSHDPLILLLAAVHALIVWVLCWIVRTAAMKHVDASAVAVIMPFSAVVTGAVSLILGKDTLSSTFIAGAVLGLGAVIVSGICDSIDAKKMIDDQQQNI